MNKLKLCAGLSGICVLAVLIHASLTAADSEDNMLKATRPQPPIDLAIPAKTETATFALG
jgi:hypothetical protein